MNITKFGETYNINEDKGSYKISGDLIETVQGNVIVNVNTLDENEQVISSINGDYLVLDNAFNFRFMTTIDRKEEQLEIIKLITDAIETILNDEV